MTCLQNLRWREPALVGGAGPDPGLAAEGEDAALADLHADHDGSAGVAGALAEDLRVRLERRRSGWSR